jgi:agmatinase
MTSHARLPFDPDAAASEEGGVYGLPHGPDGAAVWIVPVPFDATTSYRQGTARGPAALRRASRQVELFDVGAELAGSASARPYHAGLFMQEEDERLVELQAEASARAAGIIARGGAIDGELTLERDLARVNAIGEELNAIVHARVREAFERQKLPAVVGGDHSVPFGALRAASERFPGLGVLHFDAHADLRHAYEGFEWSHASIFDNVVRRLPAVARLVQVGLRDVGQREREAILAHEGRVHALFDAQWAAARLAGADLRALVRRTLEHLPGDVWISFDVDGLDPVLCPNTGTPVPGGLGWHEALLWLDELARSGRRVVGLDLCEVNPGPAWQGRDDDADSWDAIVGARLLYRMIGTALACRNGPVGNGAPGRP